MTIIITIIYMEEKTYSVKDYEQFAKQNPATGTLKIQAYAANQAFPLADVEIEVSKIIDNHKVVFFEGKTDSSGIIDNITLPAELKKDDIESFNDIYYTTYDLTARYPKTNAVKNYKVGIFDGLKIIQPIKFSSMIDGDVNG